MKMLKSIIIVLISILTLVKSENCVTLYKLEKDTCGEICLSSYIASFAVRFGGVIEGDCKSQAYTVLDHTEKISVGPFGSFEVKVFKKEVTESMKFLQGQD